jgi:hypothetical protein
MLLSTREFVACAVEWFRRQGGNVIHCSPYVIAAAMQFDAKPMLHIGDGARAAPE